MNQRLIREIGFMKDDWIFLLNIPVGAPVGIAVEAMQAFGKEVQEMIDAAVKAQAEAQAMVASDDGIDHATPIEVTPEA